MPAQPYTASKSRSQNRPGWSISFRHPLRFDSRGKPGLKMRRGLGTDDEAKADQMTQEMNTILSDQSWWNATKREEAEKRFTKTIVEAFYDEIQTGRDDPEKRRERQIPLPSAENGYSRILFVGTTGAGKTSLLRQIIGSDPDDDRFPSTAPAKTTIADIEVIQAKGTYSAVVTFFSEFQVQTYIEECIGAACLAAFEAASEERIADRFLSHSDQKFRLSYILGNWKEEPEVEDQDLFSNDESENGPDTAQVGCLTADERHQNLQTVKSYIERIEGLSKKVAVELSRQLGVNVSRLSGEDRDAAEELFDYLLSHQEDYYALVHDVLEDVSRRFDTVTAGELLRNRSGWPDFWVFETEDRAEFIRQIRWFSSNYWPEFGRLLTPVVQGIRVKGPLFPIFSSMEPQLVLIDGQGLGHTPDSSASVTTHVTRKFSEVDVILLVDNAQQPMQAAPLSVLRAVASSGHLSKLGIAFTHFDQIKGKNLRTFADKRNHVMDSIRNALVGLQNVLGSPIVKAIERGIDERCFMLGGVDTRVDKLPERAADYMRTQLSDMVGFFERAIMPPPPPQALPIYDPTGIAFAVQDGIVKFMGPWMAKLGLGTHSGVHREHWSRIKALNRRIAGELNIEYDSLRPVADLVARLTESLSLYLDKPYWTREPVDDSEAEAAISPIRRGVSSALHDIAATRLIEQHLADWRTAYDNPEYRGTGSTHKRAVMLRNIYEEAAPCPDTVMTRLAGEFLAEIRRIVETAIRAGGGDVQLST